MKLISRVSYVVLTIVLTCVSLQTSAGPKGDGFRHFHSIFRQLDVTTEQKADIRQLARQLREDVSVFSADKEAFRESLTTLIEADEFDEAAVTQLLTDNLSTQQAVGLLRAQFKHDVWVLLTEEQQANAEALFEQREFDADAVEDKLERLYEKLELTDEQIAQADAIFDQLQTEKAALTEALATYKEAERAIITADTFSADDWNALFNANSATFVELKLIRITAMAEFKSILTDAQLASLEDFGSRRGRHRG